MGKKKSKTTYVPFVDEKTNAQNTNKSEVKTPNNENSKKNEKKNQVEDINKSQESLKEGTQFDIVRNERKQKINECSSNEKDKSLKGPSLVFQYKNSSDDKNEQTGKRSNNKASEESNKQSNINKKLKNKNTSSDQNNVKSSECLDDQEKNENNKTVLDDSDKSSKSTKKKKTNANLLDQQSRNSSSDKKADCETINFNKNNDEVCQESLFNQKSQNDSNKKLKLKISNSNTKFNKNNEEEFVKSTNLSNKKKLKHKNNEDQISNNSLNKIEQSFNKLETTSTNYKQEDKSKKDRNHSSIWSINNHGNKTKNDNCKDRSQFDCESFLKEIDQDLFTLPENIALAHCVAEDLRMGAGIAVDFKIRFGGVGKLIDQNLKVGHVGVVNRHGQFAFYLITKKYSSGKPTMLSLKMALESLLSKMRELNLTKLGIPKIGCGLDGLDWSNVKSLLVEIFAGSGIDIDVCIPSKILDRKAPPPLKVFTTSNNLWEMEAQTDIIIFIDLEKVNKNDWTSDVINKVDDKYPFKEKLLKEVKNKKINSGKIIIYEIKNEKIICVFFEQKTFYGCVEDVFRAGCFKSKATKYLAIQSGSLKSDDILKRYVWIVLIFRSISSYNELWLCGNTEQKEYRLPFDQYFRNQYNSNSSDNSFSSKMSRDYKHNDNYQSFHSKERNSSNIKWLLPQNSCGSSSFIEK